MGRGGGRVIISVGKEFLRVTVYVCTYIYRRGGLGDWCRRDGRLIFHTIPLTAF